MKNFVFWLTILLALTQVPSVAAATTDAPSVIRQTTVTTLTASPALHQIELRDKQDIATYSIQLGNLTDKSLRVAVSAADFASLNATGGVAFIGESNRSLQNKHGVVPWIQIAQKDIVIGPNEQKAIPVTLSGLTTMPPGGHYGAIIFRVVGTDGTEGGNKVSVNQVVSSLLFLTTSSGGTKSLELKPLSFGKILYNLPERVNIFFKATGNTQTTPRGFLTIKNASGKIVRSTIVNQNSGLVLPGSTRLFETTLGNVSGDVLWPGKYTAELSYRPDTAKIFETEKFSFYYVNLKICFVIFAVLLCVIVSAIFIYRMYSRKRRARNSRA